MTTKVTVHAHAGWPVSVVGISTTTGTEVSGDRVEPHTEKSFYVHSGVDLRIHEIQPVESVELREFDHPVREATTA